MTFSEARRALEQGHIKHVHYDGDKEKVYYYNAKKGWLWSYMDKSVIYKVPKEKEQRMSNWKFRR